MVSNLVINKLISNRELVDNIIYSDKILKREVEIESTGKIEGYLYGNKDASEKFINVENFNKKLYEENESLMIGETKYYKSKNIAGRLKKPSADSRITKDLGTGYAEVNTILNLVILSFYNTYIENLKKLIDFTKEDLEKEKYKNLIVFTEKELEKYKQDIRSAKLQNILFTKEGEPELRKDGKVIIISISKDKKVYKIKGSKEIKKFETENEKVYEKNQKISKERVKKVLIKNDELVKKEDGKTHKIYFEYLKEIISNLEIIWAKPKKEIGYENGNKIEVIGVYGMGEKSNYIDIMDKLEVRQMILQGPPGTSKTYTAKDMIYQITKKEIALEHWESENLEETKNIYKEYLYSKGIKEEDIKEDEKEKLKKEAILKHLEKEDWIEEFFKKYIEEKCDKKEGIKIEKLEKDTILNYCQVKDDSGKWDKKIGWDIIQFHPSYGYEDFIRGITVETKDKIVSYDTVDKTLGKMAKLAVDNPFSKFFLIIDEINRANLATVFGELIYALEYRDEEVSTPYAINEKINEKNNDEKNEKKNTIKIPKNLYIIGTMNTSDKSIGGIDYAIRRRFLFFPLLPSEKVIEEYYKENKLMNTDIHEQSKSLFISIEKFFKGYLSEEYHQDDVQIGHTYFLKKEEEELKYSFKYQVLPILREYYKDGLFDDNLKEQDDINESKEALEKLHNFIRGKETNDKEKLLNDLFKLLIGAE